jgi:hypothetical protein
MMVQILEDILLTNFMSKEPKFAYYRVLVMYISMSGFPKIIARIELNLPLCLLMISFEILMMVLIYFMSGP